MDNRVHLSFEDLSINGEYSILEWGKDDDELKEVAIKNNLKVPSRDLSIFKCKYAMVDKQNKNKCTLPRKEVKKAITTLNGKSIDKDHYRQNTIGYWLQAELDGDDIIAYGAFWKSNFPDEYKIIKERMDGGKMKISFEAWGERKFKENGSYDLTDIEFAGGALLFDSEPAFPNAEVIEFSNKTLEFAKIIEEKGVLIEMEKPIQPVLEESSLNFNWDNGTIARMMSETECPTCKIQGWNDILSIDFENSVIKSKCPSCGGISEYTLTPSVKVIKKGKVSEPIKSNKPKELEDLKNSNMTDLKESHAKGGLEVDEQLKKYNKATVEELVKYFDETLASITVKDTEIASLKSEKETFVKASEDTKLIIENSKLEIEKVKTEAKLIKNELDKRINAEKAAFVKARKDELGEEFAKDLTDEDISNDLKFENAKLKKELKLAKEGKPSQGGLEAGAKSVPEVDSFGKQKAIQDMAFPKEEK